jgi:hypothetical protein
MKETRIKISSIIKNQLPQFVIEEFPLVSDFLTQYYISLENQGNVSDLLQNIDQYIKLDNLTNLVESVELSSDVTFFDTTINVKLEPENGFYGTAGFPDSYGLLLIDSEIITYTSKTSTSFEGCVRGFNGITSHDKKDELSFSETQSEEHFSSSVVTNLSILFLKEFFKKIKKQFTPGFEERELYLGLNENIFVKQSIDFYSSKGTDNSFKILFGALYGEDVEIIKPRDYLIQPSDAQYRITSDLVVESIEGNPENLVNGTLYQFQDDSEEVRFAQGTITKVEKIKRGTKDYYIISLDFDYNKDIQPVGTVYGEFKIHPKTQVVSNASSGSTTLEVDSTVGFPSSGDLIVNFENETSIKIQYTSKTLNQFLGCSGVSQDISSSTEVKFDYLTYGNYDNEKVKVRIFGVLSELKVPDNTRYYSNGDLIKIKTLGADLKDIKSNNWFFNLPIKYEVLSVQLVDTSDRSYIINLQSIHTIKVGDNVSVISSNGVNQSGNVVSFNNETSFTVQFGSQKPLLDTTQTYEVRKNVSKVNSKNYPSVNQYTSNVQNVYVDENGDIYIASSSLPSYSKESLQVNDRSVSFSGNFNGTTLNIGNHGFYTGDAIVYKPLENNSLGISTGIYFIKRESDTEVKLSKSKNNIFNENFITVSGSVENAKFELLDFTYDNLETQTLDSQKLIRKISEPKTDSKIYKTTPGLTGIFINGVELLNYKSRDNIYYGPIESIFPTSPGSGYDIINPPILSIVDVDYEGNTLGSGASGYCSIIGGLERIDILDPGFDYIEEPVIEIRGGNGFDASAKVNLISFEHIESFNSESSSGLIKLDPINQIEFLDYHKFRDAEEVIYQTNTQTSVGGLSTNSSYFVSVKDGYNIQLHKSLSDAVSGINTIKLQSFGIGNHSFKSKNKKKKIGSIFVENRGSNYQNKLITVESIGINTSSSTIKVNNHGYKTGEIVVYESTGTPVGGLTSSRSYYVTKINDNEFRLSQVGISTLGITSSFYYDTNQYVKLSSIGSGIHKFNYPEIVVSIKGRLGISTLTGKDFGASIQPIFRGELQSIFVSSGGNNYGSGDILNYNRQPSLQLNSGSGIELIPVVSNGQIVDVLIKSPGTGYNSPPNLKVDGSGIGAILTPIISNGSISEVKVIYGGIGYKQEDTTISVTSPGSGAKLEVNVKSWKINLVERLIESSKYLNNPQIFEDDGILFKGLNSEYGLQYTHSYAPRSLRSLIQATTFDDGVIKYVPDLQKNSDGIELLSNAHSPIIGWAYDGNPIYGPYGYSSQNGGSVRCLRPGYNLRTDLSNLVQLKQRPDYPSGFFIEDYVFDGNGDLDEHNGRFGITPEYPNGIYAYFTTINSQSTETNIPFRNYRRPIFPYAIGDSYKSTPIEFNFDKNSNQDYVNINETNWKRNTAPYSISSYEYLFNPNQVKLQNSVVKNTLIGSLDRIEIENGGNNYKLKEKINFNNKTGYGAKAEISSIKGKRVSNISVASSIINDVEFYPQNQEFIGFSTRPHNYSNNDLVTFTGKNEYKKSGNISVVVNNLTLTTGVGSAQYTGIITYFNVSGNLNYPIIRENDIYQINNEQVKVLNIDSQSSRIRVLRNQNGTVGLTSYTAGSILTENPRKFTLSFGISTSYNFNVNREFYFNPKESIGLGTTSGVGIVSTLYFSNPGVGVTQVTIIPRSIYIKDHNLTTGDSLIYSTNGGSPISVSTNGISSFTLNDKSIVYATKISNDLIGISTIKVGIGSTGSLVSVGSTIQSSILYFTSLGTGNNHSFKSNNNILSGSITKNLATVSTAENHELSLFDLVDIKVTPGISTTFIIKYNDYNRRLVINPRSFSSIDTVNDMIRIDNHNYYNGQKVIYNATISSGGLSNNQIYYVVVVDQNNIKLSNSYYQATKLNPETINISTSYPGTISPINPPINFVKNQKIVFDLSDSSLSFSRNSIKYSAFDLRFYSDKEFIDEFISTKSSPIFEVEKSGEVGINTLAKISITLNDNIPDNLYYSLIPINLNINSQLKTDIITDTEVLGFNKISLVESKYNGTYSITGISSLSFSYNILEVPEKSFYDQSIEYYINKSDSAKGEISSVKLLNKGKNYSSLPSITSVETEFGSNAILKPHSDQIGKITSIEIQDIGFDFPADYSVRPTVKFPTILKLESLSSFDYIGITSIGKNYSFAPSLIVIDSITNQVIEDIEISYNLGDSLVTIKKNNYSISNVIPKIIPTNNSNGIKISNISFNNSTKKVTVSLGSSFNDPDDFPFEVGSKVLIEGVSVGVNTDGRGYNSSDYNYALFTLTEVNSALGGVGAGVTYVLSEYLENGEVPGTFNSVFSSGRIIPESYFPTFNPVLKRNNFYTGETLYSSSSMGSVQSWDADNQYLKVSTIGDFILGDTVLGETSSSIGIVKDILNSESDYKINSSSIVKKGWNSETGFLNNDFQRMHDSDYYQYFSYAIKSKIDLDRWNNPVSSLNHTVGFKKFSNLIIESDLNNVGFATNQNLGDFSSIVNISEVVGLNCFYDFDLVTENNFLIGNELKSNEIIFNSKIIQDYIESIGNRVLEIDDISKDFNSNPRSTVFSTVETFLLDDIRFKKYFILVQDKLFLNEKEFSIVSLLHNNNSGFLNQYGSNTLENSTLGFFDFSIFGNSGNLLFYPLKFKFNDYNLQIVSFSLNDNLSGITTVNLGDVVKIDSTSTLIPQGTNNPTTIVGIASTYRSSKILVQIGATDSSYFQSNELTVLFDNNDVHILDYGQITTDTFEQESSPGIGTYDAYLSGSIIKIDLIPNTSTTVDYIVNTCNISLGNTNAYNVGDELLGGSSLSSTSVGIASSGSPTANLLLSYSNVTYNSLYCIISVEDKTNQQYQVSEAIVITNLEENQSYITEFGVIQTNSSLGITTSVISGQNTEIYFTPIENIDVDVKIFSIKLGLSESLDSISLSNGSIEYDYGNYTGTNNDIKKEFNLTHQGLPIFQRHFDGSDPSIVDINNNIINIPNNFFVTGEEIVYSCPEIQTSAIGIATTTIPGIGVTNKLPTKLYIVKLDEKNVRVSASASDALKTIPNTLDLNSIGVGKLHTFTSKNQNKKVIIGIDNVIQSPVVSTSTTTRLSKNITFFDNVIYVSDSNLIYSGDLIKIDDEIMKVTSVGVGSTNVVSVIRPWIGTGISSHSSSSLVTKVYGNYNIKENKICFSDPPFGKVPIVNLSNRFDEQDYIGIATGSSFSGRVFLKSGINNTSNESYSNNYIFDDISHNFNGINKTFTLKSNGSNISGISSNNAIVLINNVFQGPTAYSEINDYDLSESLGITSITFTGTATSTNYDINTASIPRGGIILSVGSSQGLGYQPLISAGGTAIVSSAGTIQSISIGSSGSGYRSGVQSIVNVGVLTSSSDLTNIKFIGTATISNGNVVSIAITNPGLGYTSSNPPTVIFDSPLSYSNIPLIYSSQSPAGIGTGATVDIVVGQGSSVVSFEMKNFGYGYERGEILTIPKGGSTGIPTSTGISFSEFQIFVDSIYSDSFASWTLGSFQVIDSINLLFDGNKKSFPIKINGNQTTIRSKEGSNIDVQATLLVFVNDILQVPGKAYTFNGGSFIRFTEAPKEGDRCKILFYQGTGGVDTQNVDILETVKIGDTVTLTDDNINLTENSRLVYQIVSSDVIETNLYSGPGITENEELSRPLIWCKQTEDLFIDGQEISKDRIYYEPYVQPSTNIIQNIGINTTSIFVESVKAFFDSEKEYIHDGTVEKPQNKIIIVSQDSLVSASATAIVSTSGTISSIILSESGVGYSTNPIISISGPVGFGTTTLQNTALANSVIFNSSVTGISVTFGGSGYSQIQPPTVLIEPPVSKYEIIDSISYEGDFGVITGIRTTSVGVGSTGLIFDFFIPKNSILRDTSIVKVGIATTGISGIQTGYYFVIKNSNIGYGITSLGIDNQIVGIGTVFIDNVYQVASVSIGQTAVPGIGITNVAKVTVKVSNYNGLTGIGFSGFYGEYSWGKISTPTRNNPKQFNSYANVGGISSSPIIQRYNRLKYSNYNT